MITWKEFKFAVESACVQDSDVIQQIDISTPYLEAKDLGVEISEVDGHREFIVVEKD
jgi:hypothetical protein